MNEWPYDKHFDQPREGLLRQEFTTYEVKQGRLQKRIVERVFYGDNNYQDSTKVVVIASVGTNALN